MVRPPASPAAAARRRTICPIAAPTTHPAAKMPMDHSDQGEDSDIITVTHTPAANHRTR